MYTCIYKFTDKYIVRPGTALRRPIPRVPNLGLTHELLVQGLGFRAPKCNCRPNFERFGTGQACPASDVCVLEA